MSAAPLLKPRTANTVYIDTRAEASPDIISQDDLKIVFDLFQVWWIAGKNATKATCHVDSRLEKGARLAPGKYKWDAELSRVTDGTI